MKYKAVIFDMDGLLLDTERIFLKSFKRACKQLHLEFDRSVYISCVGTNSVKTKDILINGFGDGFNYDEFKKQWVDNCKEYISKNTMPLKAGVKAMLDKLKQLPLPMVVATSTSYDLAKESLEIAGIIQYFKFIMAGDQVTKGKPDPEIFLKTAEKLETEPTECLIFEDSENGVKAACAADIDVIQIPDLVKPSDELKALGHKIYKSLNNVCDEFEEIFD